MTDKSDSHPLQNQWTMWFDTPQKQKTSHQQWTNNMKEIVTVSTVEQFWGLFNNLLPASKMDKGSNFHFFKKGIEPSWEDKQNEDGGRWVWEIKGQERQRTDAYWLFSLLSVIGEQLGDDDDITGIVCSIRKNVDRIAIWTRSASDEKLQRSIVHKLLEQLKLENNNQVRIKYTVHEDAKKDGRAEPRYQIPAGGRR